MPVLATKLYAPPARQEIVPRPRLLDRLEEGGRGQLTLVSAPAGFGKTTLVSTWLAESDRPGAWLSLDEGDSDLARFLTYLVAALQTVRPGLGDEVVRALQSPQPPPADAVLAGLLNELAAVERAFILVLDDYHAIDAPTVDEALGFLVEHLPPPMHLVVATREDPPLPLPRLRARGQLTELRAADLRFTPPEAARFLNEVMGLDLSAEDVAALEARTEGWIAGLQLAALSMRGRADKARFIASFTGSHRFVMDYLVEEVLDRQPEAIQTFLLQTSILERLSGALCDAVVAASAPTGQETLEDLVRAGLFVIPLDDERRWYRYHHLFANLLRQRLHERLATKAGAVSVAELHLRASTWFEAQGSEPEAIRYALAAEDFERAAGLIEMAAHALRMGRQETTMLGWLEALPDDLIRTRPLLCAEYVWALFSTGGVEAAEVRLGDAERWVHAVTDPEARRAAVAAGMVVVNEEEFQSLPMRLAIYRAVRAQTQGDVSGTAEHAQRALDLSSEDDIVARGAAAALLGIASWMSGDLETAHRSFATGMAHLKRHGSLSDAIGGTFLLAAIRVVQGRLSDAVKTYEEALRLAEQQEEPVLPGTAGLHVGLSEIAFERGDRDAAMQHLLRSKALGERAELPEHRYRGRLAEAQLEEAQGNPRGALDLLDEAERLHLTFPLPDTCSIAALKARVWIRQGRLRKAQAWAHEQGLSAQDQLSFPREFEYATLVRLLIAQYERDGSALAIQEATDLAERLLRAAEAGGRTGRVIEILVLKALAHQTQGDITGALAALERALVLAEPEGYVQVFVGEGKPLQRLLRRVAPDGHARSYARRLLSILGERNPSASNPAHDGGAAELVQPLTAREVEIVRLIATGMTNQEIADHLFISLATVKRHIANAYGKMDVRHRTEAVVRARELGLL